MNEHKTKFRFVADPERYRPDGSHLARIPAGVVGKVQLMRVLEEALRFPDYFGRNWDALSDCLRDLSWLPSGRVNLVHADLPELSATELHTYVAVLATAVDDWKPQENYELVVIFAERDRARVLECLPA